MSDLTLEDIAKQAGVSRATVSRVVNNDPRVNEELRQRVMDVVNRTGYHPNLAARALASQHSQMIGLVLSRFSSAHFKDPYHPRLVHGIVQACNQYDYTLSLILISSAKDEEKLIPRITHRGLFDGILLQSDPASESLIERLTNANVPLVVIGRPPRRFNVSYIDIDNVVAGYNATSHLLRLGYRRVGTITGPLSTTMGADRLEGYRKAMIEHGQAIDESLIVEGDFTDMGGYYSMKQMLPARPDAVFAAADIMAIGAIRAIREAGLHIPKDIALVGFDDLPLATIPEPHLTTIRQPIPEVGFSAFEILLDLINNGLTPPRRVILDTELVVRDSCGAGHTRKSTSREK